MGPFTGPLASTGIPAKNAFALAHENNRKNEQYTLNIIYEDDQCDPKKAVAITELFLSKNNVDYIISGICSSSVLAIAPLVEKEKKVLEAASKLVQLARNWRMIWFTACGFSSGAMCPTSLMTSNWA